MALDGHELRPERVQRAASLEVIPPEAGDLLVRGLAREVSLPIEECGKATFDLRFACLQLAEALRQFVDPRWIQHIHWVGLRTNRAGC